MMSKLQKNIIYWNDQRYRADCHGMHEEEGFKAELLAAVDDRARRAGLLWDDEKKSYIGLHFEGYNTMTPYEAAITAKRLGVKIP